MSLMDFDSDAEKGVPSNTKKVPSDLSLSSPFLEDRGEPVDVVERTNCF